MVYKLYGWPGLRSNFFIVICTGKRIGNNSIGPRKYKNRGISMQIFLDNFFIEFYNISHRRGHRDWDKEVGEIPACEF